LDIGYALRWRIGEGFSVSIFITAYQNRTSREQITFTAQDGTNPALAANDKVRIKIGRAGATPLLDIVSGTSLPGGTYVTKANPCTLELVGADLAESVIKPGIYDISAIVVDSTDANRDKLAEQGVFALIGTMGGNSG
jgi:hypothetical protein